MRAAVGKAILLLALAIAPGCGDHSISLFDGKTLNGWECQPVENDSHWTADQGELTGENPDLGASIIWTTESFRDFEIDLDYMALTKDYDSGIFIRGESHQVQIGISRSLEKDMTACIYAPADNQGSYPGQTDHVEDYHQFGAWNHLKVIVTGKQIQTILNGEPLVDYQAVNIPDEGPLGLQLHGGVHMAIKFRNIRLLEITSEQ